MEPWLGDTSPETGNGRPELSEREKEILVLVASGASNKLIAQQLVISPNTVKVHVRNIFGKIGVASRTEATLYAIREGLVAVPGGLPLPAEYDAVETGEAGNIMSTVATAGQATTVPIAPASSEDSAGSGRRLGHRWPVSWWVAGLLTVALLIAGAAATYTWIQATPTLTPTTLPPTPLPRWKSRADLPTPRSGLAVVAYENQLYAIGGQSDAGVTGAMERYDTAAGAWTPLTPKPLAVADIGAAILGGKIYVPAGRLASGALSTALEVYDPNSNRWERRADLPVAVSAYALVAFEGRLFLFGGWDGSAYLDLVQIYDPSTDTWQSGVRMPTPRAFSAAAAAGGSIYVVGGRDGSRELDVSEAFTPGSTAGQGTWQTRAPLPVAVAGLGLTTIADVLYAVGGAATPETLGAWSYFPARDAWQSLDTPDAPPTVGLGVVAVQSQLFAVGGDQSSAPSNQHLAFQAIYTTIFPGVSGGE